MSKPQEAQGDVGGIGGTGTGGITSQPKVLLPNEEEQRLAEIAQAEAAKKSQTNDSSVLENIETAVDVAQMSGGVLDDLGSLLEPVGEVAVDVVKFAGDLLSGLGDIDV